MAVQQKMVLIVSGLSPLELMLTYNEISDVVGYDVDDMLCDGCFVYLMLLELM